LTTVHLCLGIVLCGLEGFGAQLQLWRRLCLEPIGPFAPVAVVDQAVYNRLERAAGAMRAFFQQVSGWMAEQMGGLEDRTLVARVTPPAARRPALTGRAHQRLV
jgi:hypothetical protein